MASSVKGATCSAVKTSKGLDLSSGLLISMVTLSKLLKSCSSTYLSVEWGFKIAATEHSCCNNYCL